MKLCWKSGPKAATIFTIEQDEIFNELDNTVYIVQWFDVKVKFKVVR